MYRIIFGIFSILHGLVHLLYAGHAAGYFELTSGLTWPGGAWALSAFDDPRIHRIVAAAGCVLAAIVFVTGGISLLARQPLWRPSIITAAAISAVLYLLMWDGALGNLADKGLFAILINAALLCSVLLFGQPTL